MREPTRRDAGLDGPGPGVRAGGRTWGRGETGSIALLLPVAVLVLVGLATIAVDLAAVQGGQRRLVDLAGTIATDAVGQVDVDRAFAAGGFAVDRAAAQRHADRSVAAAVATDARLEGVGCAVTVDGAAVTVRCEATVPPVFGRGTPWGGARTVTAVDVARPATE